MKPPPLPENFGNYALEGLVEVLAPTDVSWWPQTTGWLWLGALLSVYLLYRIWRALKAWHHNRYRREALLRLTHLRVAPPDPRLVTAASEILKVTALAVFPRSQIARLSGEDWVEFLNSRCEREMFDEELTALMADTQYRCAVPSVSQQAALLHACRHWVAQHQGPTDA